MASLLVDNHEKRKTSEEVDGIRTLNELPDALLEFIMDFLRGDFKCWASLLGTCKYAHNQYIDNLVKLKILWEKAQSIQSKSVKRRLYNCYFYTTINLNSKVIGAEGAKYVAEALKVNTSLTMIGLRNNDIGDEGEQSLREVWIHNDGLFL